MPAAAPPAPASLRPCRPADARCPADSPLRPLYAAVAPGVPLEPAMRTVVRALGFDAFSYALATEPPTRSGGRRGCGRRDPRNGSTSTTPTATRTSIPG